jgi:hypothetical protein
VPAILDPDSRLFSHHHAIWMAVSLALLAGLSALPPQLETHKQFHPASHGVGAVAGEKDHRAIPHTRQVRCPSPEDPACHHSHCPYWRSGPEQQLFFAYDLPLATAALYCGSWMTMLWTVFASAAYCSYLYPVATYEATSKELRHLALRMTSLFLAAMAVNRFFRFKQSRNTSSRSAV